MPSFSRLPVLLSIERLIPTHTCYMSLLQHVWKKLIVNYGLCTIIRASYVFIVALWFIRKTKFAHHRTRIPKHMYIF